MRLHLFARVNQGLVQLQGESGCRWERPIGNAGDPVEPQPLQHFGVTIQDTPEQGRVRNDLAKIHVVIEDGATRLLELTKQQATDVEQVDHQIPELLRKAWLHRF